MSESEKVLMVDDEPSILEGFARELREEVALDTATSGAAGLEAVDQSGPYAVIISDFKMPQMNGIEFLAEVKCKAPDTVRMMLTGYADVQIAIEAVNKGHIFRLLTKPCTTEDLLNAIRAGLELYRLVNAEKVLLEKTVHGAVKVLTDILGLANPSAFSRASRVKDYVRHIAKRLDLDNIWEFELAAMLSQIGYVTLPPGLLGKANAGKPLTSKESKMYSECPEISSNIIENIPRFERIAAIIRIHQDSSQFMRKEDDLKKVDRVDLGGFILMVALEFDRLLTRDLSPKVILKRLPLKVGNEVPEIFDALKRLRIEQDKRVIKEIKVAGLNRSMIFGEDVFAKDGRLLANKGQEATFPLIERLRNYAKGIGVVQPFQVIA